MRVGAHEHQVGNELYRIIVVLYFFILMLASSVTDVVTTLSAPNATNEVHSITVTCTIHPDSTADQCVVMGMADGRVTRTGRYIYNIIYS